MDVVDKFTAIDLKAATSAGEIAEGLSQFANLGSLAGINLDQAAAYVATIADVTQMSGSSAGQAMKMILSRYGNVKAGAYGKLNLESDATDETSAVNDVEKVLKNLGISLRSSNLSFRDFDEVLDEIAEKWTSLDRVSQKAVATAFAGVRQQEAFVTLMQNWEKYEELLETSQNSEGTAERKYSGAYQESLQASYNKLTATLEQILNNAQINDLLDSGVKLLTSIVEWLPVIAKWLPNLFFSIQSFRALSGNSLVQKMAGSISRSNFADLYKEYHGAGWGRLKSGWSAFHRGLWGRRSAAMEAAREARGKHSPAMSAQAYAQHKAAQSTTGAGTSGQQVASSGQQATPPTVAPVQVTDKNGHIRWKDPKTGRWVKNPGGQPQTQTQGQQSPRTRVSGQAVLAGVSIALNSMATAYSAYLTEGRTHKRINGKGEEVDTQSSEAAHEAGRNIVSRWSWIPVVGQMFGEMVAEPIMQAIDAERDDAKRTTEKAEEIIGCLNSIQTEVQDVTQSISSIAIEDMQNRAEAVREISDILYKEDNKNTREQLQKYLQQQGKSLSEVLNDLVSSNNATRMEAARAFNIAQSQLNTEQQINARASDEYALTHDVGKKWLNYNKTRTNEGYNSYGILDGSRPDYRSGSVAAGVTGGVLLLAGLATLFTGGIALPAILGGLGTAGLVAGIGTYGGAGDAEILAAQQKEENAWTKQSFYELRNSIDDQIARTKEQISALEDSTTSIDENTTGLAELSTKLKALTELDASLEEYEEYMLARIDEDNANRMKTILQMAKTEDGRFLTDLTINEAGNVKLSGLVKALLEAAQQLEAEDRKNNRDGSDKRGLYGVVLDENGEPTEAFKQLAKTVLGTDEELKAAMTGANYTVAGALEFLGKKDWGDLEILENFANAFGVTVDTFVAMGEKFRQGYGTLTYSELIKSTEDLVKEQNEYHNLIVSITDSTKSATEWMAQITTKFPELITYMHDTPTLIEKIVEKMRDLSQYEFKTQWETLASDENAWDSKDPNANTFKKQLLGYVETHYGSERRDAIAQALSEAGGPNGTGATTLNDAIRYMMGLSEGDKNLEALREGLTAVGSDIELVSDNFKEGMKIYIDYNSKLLGMQIDNLTKQRDTLKEITHQREYENKLIEAKLRLEDALQDKRRVYREGVGFVYEPDQKAIAEAQKNLEEVQIEKDVSAITKQLEVLQDQKADWDNRWEIKNFEETAIFAKAFESQFLPKILGDGTSGGLAAVTTELEGFKGSFNSFTKKLLDQKDEDKQNVLEELEANWNALSDFLQSGGYQERFDAIDRQLYKETRSKSPEEMIAANPDKYNELLGNFQKSYTKAENAGYITNTNNGYGGNWTAGGWGYGGVMTQSYASEKPIVNLEDYNKSTIEKGGAYLTYVPYRNYGVTVLSSAEDPLDELPDKFRNGGLNDLWRIANLGGSKGIVGHVENEGGGVNKLADLPDGVYVNSGTLYDTYFAVNDGRYYPLTWTSYRGAWSKDARARYEQLKKTNDKLGTRGSFYKINPADIYANANGSLNTSAGLSVLNELGTEAIVTPSGTITALPAHAGIVPADITKNLWMLGEIAPGVLRAMDRINPSAAMPVNDNSRSIDESFNIANLTMNVSADSSFDADAFVASIRSRVALTRNSRK